VSAVYMYLIWGYDVGGNNGNVVVRAFTQEDDAERFATNAKARRWNWHLPAEAPPAFEVEEIEVVQSLDDIRDELVDPDPA
jgi:hypothetical protein